MKVINGILLRGVEVMVLTDCTIQRCFFLVELGLAPQFYFVFQSKALASGVPKVLVIPILFVG